MAGILIIILAEFTLVVALWNVLHKPALPRNDRPVK